MHTYRMLIEYEGQYYHGWQVQPDQITVQQKIEEALLVLCKQPVRVIAAGRTDAGVHATGQVGSFRTEADLDLGKTLVSINALTPRNISILDIKTAPERFDARRWAIGREYHYYILNRRAPCSLRRRICWHVPYQLDVDAMSQAASFLIGEHDFTSFRASDCGAKSPVRVMAEASVSRNGDGMLEFIFYATGFLKHQIRSIIGTLEMIGRGKIEPQQMKIILEAKNRDVAGPTAPPQGLVFSRADYPEDIEPFTLFPAQSN